MRATKGCLALVAVASLLGCSGAVDLNGSGATFPYPLYTRWVSDYSAQHGVRINYQQPGSGGGIKQISEQIVDFGASDGPMSDTELANAQGGELLHIPTVLGGVTIAYSIPDFTDTLLMDPELIADIFLGKVTRWNDPRVLALNPTSRLPDLAITTVHRSDGSGTTYVFTDYLANVSPEWAAGPGKGKDVDWPVGLAAAGNALVAGQIRQTPGAVGYIESVFALQNRILTAKVKNRAGNFVTPSQHSITAAAAEAVATLGESTDYRISIVNPPGADAYPISSFTWLLVYRQQTNATKGRALIDFMKWAVTEGQAQAAELQYGPLPESMRPAIVSRIESIKLP
jgi:phosphate transport system substrate-binding protein